MKKANSSPKSRRRNFYIDKNFQTKFIIKFWLIVAAGSFLTLAAVICLAQHSTTVAIVDGRVAVHTKGEYLLPLLVQTLLAELVLVSLATVLMTMFISHKIAGPLYRIRMSLKALGTGDLSAIHLRQGDQLREIETAYNEAVAGLGNKVSALKNASSLDEVKKSINTFKGL